MVRSSTVMLLATLALAPGCKKKSNPADTGTTSGSAATAGSAAAAGSSAPSTAAGGEVQALPVVTDCPKSLGGTEKVARTLTKACGPITVTETFTVDGSLTLEPGVILKFQPDAGLVVGYHGPAKLIIKGGDAPDQRVVFTSAGDQAPGVWAGVSLDDGADRSQITGLDIEYAGQTGSAALVLRDAADITFTRSSITHAKEAGVTTSGGTSSFAQFGGNRFDDIGGASLVTDASVVGALAAGNTFGKDAVIEIRGGRLTGDATWKNAGAPYRVTETVYAETSKAPATLTITDATLQFAADAELLVGYNQHGKLRITGSTLTGVDGKPGSWRGIRVHDGGEATIDTTTLSAGGTDDSGVLVLKRGGKLTLGEVTFKDSKVGLWVEDQATLAAGKPLTFAGNERAARLSPTALGALTAANVFADGDIIEVSDGDLHATTTWQTQPKAIVRVLGEVHVDGSFTLTINAGGTYQWKDGAKLTIGYRDTGTLKIAGTAQAPVTFAAIPQGQPWKGVDLNDSARAVDIAYLELAEVEGDAGITAKKTATGKLDHVKCSKCAATVAPACGSKLDTASAVTAGAGTAVGVKKPTGC